LASSEIIFATISIPVNDHPLSGWLEFFPTLPGEKQKHVSVLMVAVETGREAPGFNQNEL
jgi:hypothetical protein